ncbi:MAG: DM13 domain-containing protein [Cyanobacteria bacterium P01_F01_bin.42]
MVGLTVASLGASSLEFIQAANGSAHAMPIKVALKTSQGEFRNAEKSTKGNATIKTIDGKQFLHLGSNFTTSNGPQVEVLLHRDAVPQSYNSSNYVSLGEIKSFQGEQWYEIPAGVDPSGYQSVSIWCREFDVTFGFATLLQS